MNTLELEQAVRMAFPNAQFVSIEQVSEPDDSDPSVAFGGVLVDDQFENLTQIERFRSFQSQLQSLLWGDPIPEVKLLLLATSEWLKLSGQVA